MIECIIMDHYDTLPPGIRPYKAEQNVYDTIPPGVRPYKVENQYEEIQPRTHVGSGRAYKVENQYEEIQPCTRVGSGRFNTLQEERAKQEVKDRERERIHSLRLIQRLQEEERVKQEAENRERTFALRLKERLESVQNKRYAVYID